MPVKSLRACAAPGCGALVASGYCEKHAARASERRSNGGRGTAAERGYDARWRKAREQHLRAHPLCAECKRHGRITPARVVDHIVPHRGDQVLFWDESNWQSLCDHTSPWNCHGAKIAKGE